MMAAGPPELSGADGGGPIEAPPGAGTAGAGRGFRAPRSAGAVALALLLPGVRRLRAGWWESGGFLLGTWLLLWGALLFWLAGGGGTGAADAPLALLTFVLGVGASLFWSLKGGGRRFGPIEFDGDGAEWGPLPGNGLAVLGAWLVGWMALAALLAPFLAPYDPVVQGSLVSGRLLPPSLAHPLGTDQFARDVLSRILFGARVSLAIGSLAVGLAVTLGTLVGAVSGYLGGWTDEVLMRLVDAVIAFPRLVLLITVVALFQPSLTVIVLVLGFTLWPTTARLVRGEVLSLRERPFVEAARSLGYSRPRIVLRHLVPNVAAPILVTASLGMGETIVLEAGLSFLDLGIQPPAPSWGAMIADGRTYLLNAWWVATFPGLAIVATVLAFNLVGEGVQETLDPRLRRGPP